MSYTVFSNFRIDSEERLQRLKDSYNSFSNSNITNWAINIRGPLKYKTADFLKANVKSNLNLFFFESNEGWFHDSRNMIKFLKNDYILFWIEDQINIGGKNYLNECIKSMRKNSIDYLVYSWFHNGDNLKSILSIEHKEDNNIIYTNYDRNNHNQRIKLAKKNSLTISSYVISATAVFNKKLFIKLIKKNDPLLKRWNKNTPFDFEKNSNDIHWLPFKYAVSNKEIFAPIDDNHGQLGYSLIDRGLYKERKSRRELIEIRQKNIDLTYKVNINHSKIKIFLFYTKIYIREFINNFYSKLFF